MTSNSLALAPAAPHDQTTPRNEGDLRLLRATVQAYLDEIDELAARMRQTLDLAGGSPTAIADAVRTAAQRSIPRWHFEMLNDTDRNEALIKSIAAAVRPGDHVLDIGSGSGLLAMVAAQSGAGHVTTCEANPLLAEVATQIIEAHGYSDVITVLPRWSTGLDADRDLGGRVDLVVSEIVDCGLVGEGLLPSVRHARECLLKPGGRMVPDAGRIVGQVVQSTTAVGLNHIETVGGFDVSALNLFATKGHFPLRTHSRAHTMLSDAAVLASFDLYSDPLTDAASRVALRVAEDGVAHGLVAWFELDLGADETLSNGPENVTTHWGQAFVAFSRPVAVHAGESLTVAVSWQDGRLFATPQL
jgi:type II protein arginine methyltransferase